MVQLLEGSCSLGLAGPRAFWRWLFLGHSSDTLHRITQGQPSMLRGAGRGFTDGTGEWRRIPGEGFPGSCSLPIPQCPSPVTGFFCHEAPNPHCRQ